MGSMSLVTLVMTGVHSVAASIAMTLLSPNTSLDGQNPSNTGQRRKNTLVVCCVFVVNELDKPLGEVKISSAVLIGDHYLLYSRFSFRQRFR